MEAKTGTPSRQRGFKIKTQINCLRVQLMNIQRDASLDEVFYEYKSLLDDDLFTNVEIVSGDKKRFRIHGLVLAASSVFISDAMKSLLPLQAKHTILLPDVSSVEIDVLVNILYGLETMVPKELVPKVKELGSLLGITIDLPYKTAGENESSSANSPPMCCWHCNSTFLTLPELEEHLKLHLGESFRSKEHRCDQCQMVFSSMWKYRQHLVNHKAPIHSAEDDHRYAERIPETNQTLQGGIEESRDATVTDHPYSLNPHIKKEVKDQGHAIASTRDHSYSAPSSPLTPPGLGADKKARRRKKIVKTGVKKKRHTIQALGHTYAAARPRKTSSSKSDGGSEKKLYPCDQCDKAFPQPYRLNRHIREVHIKERLHSCSICELSFFKVTSRDRHELTHTDHEKWKCEKCQKVFRDQSSLTYHNKHLVCSKQVAARTNRPKS